MPTELNPIRIVLFANRPTAMLIHAHEGTRFRLPEVSAPFEKEEVARAIGESGLTVRVSIESGTGRWGMSIARKMREEQAERAQNQKLLEAQQATLLRHANDPLERDRASLMLHKHEVDDALREAKITFGKAKSDVVRHGRYMDPAAYRKLEAKIERLKQESQGIQVLLGQLREQEKSKNNEGFDLRNKRFRAFARKLLSEELFNELEDLVDSDKDPSTFEPDYLEDDE
jgi:hypothetical protein